MRYKKKIIILHGWTYNTDKWKPFVNELEKNSFMVKLLKIPGLTAPLYEAWNIENYIDWLKMTLDKEKGKVVLLGHSNGGLIATGFALKYSDKVSDLILLDSTGIYHNELPIRFKRFVFEKAAKIGKKILKASIFKKALYKLAKAHDYENASSIAKKTMINLLKVDYSDDFKNIKVPTLILWGKNDKVTPLIDGEKMNAEINDSKLFVIDEASHSPQLTHSKKTADLIIKNL